MPIRNSQGEILGVTQIINKIPDSSIFTQNDELLLSAFSALAGATIEKSVLLDRTQSLLTEASLVKNNLTMILKSIADVVITLDANGNLTTINHPVKLGLRESDVEKMKKRSFTLWLSENPQLVHDIEQVYQDGQTINIFDYGLKVGSDRQKVNYTILQLGDLSSLSVNKSTNGVVLVVELISYEKRLLSILGRYMSSILANQVIQQGGAVLTGQKKQNTVLIADIKRCMFCTFVFTLVNSTTAHLEPTVVVSMLNDFYSHTVEAIVSEDGILDKYTGDAAIGVFGLPYTQSDDCYRAIQSAFRVRSGLDAVNATNRREGRPLLTVCIGLATGSTISGNIGSLTRSEYTIVGDNVRVAQAMETAAGIYGVTIACDYETMVATSNQFIFRELDTLRLHKCGLISTFQVVQRVDTHFSEDERTTLQLYTQGLYHYRMREWDTAKQYFNSAVQQSNDQPSRHMIDRCTSIIKGDVPIGIKWDGAWEIQL